jgi:hypothetical protein
VSIVMMSVSEIPGMQPASRPSYVEPNARPSETGVR